MSKKVFYDGFDIVSLSNHSAIPKKMWSWWHVNNRHAGYNLGLVATLGEARRLILAFRNDTTPRIVRNKFLSDYTGEYRG